MEREKRAKEREAELEKLKIQAEKQRLREAEADRKLAEERERLMAMDKSEPKQSATPSSWRKDDGPQNWRTTVKQEPDAASAAPQLGDKKSAELWRPKHLKEGESKPAPASPDRWRQDDRPIMRRQADERAPDDRDTPRERRIPTDDSRTPMRRGGDEDGGRRFDRRDDRRTDDRRGDDRRGDDRRGDDRRTDDRRTDDRRTDDRRGDDRRGDDRRGDDRRDDGKREDRPPMRGGDRRGGFGRRDDRDRRDRAERDPTEWRRSKF